MLTILGAGAPAMIMLLVIAMVSVAVVAVTAARIADGSTTLPRMPAMNAVSVRHHGLLRMSISPDPDCLAPSPNGKVKPFYGRQP
jgi:hypothetical protein